MTDQLATKISESPTYRKLVRTRATYSWFLTLLMLIAYFTFLSLVAFHKEWLAEPIGDGVTTWSIPAGIGLIVFTIVITGIYVRRANSEFDALNDQIHKEQNL